MRGSDCVIAKSTVLFMVICPKLSKLAKIAGDEAM